MGNKFFSRKMPITGCNTGLHCWVKLWETQLSAAPFMNQSRQGPHMQAQAAMLHDLRTA